MMLDWSVAAQADLRRLHEYWKCRVSITLADETVDSIISHAEQLLQFPEMGYELHDPRYPGARELLDLPYLIRYRIHDEEIEIIAVIHGARG
jgi:toxin ParE1/3/4